MYAAATTEFTKRNARNALDWHLAVLGLTVVTVGSVLGVAEGTGSAGVDVLAVASPIDTLAGAVVSGLVLLWMGVGLWSFLVAFVAAGKAAFGDAWRYPLSPALTDRLAPRVAERAGWPLVVDAYAVTTPVGLAIALLGAATGWSVAVAAVALIGLVFVGAPAAAVAMVVVAERIVPRRRDWRPNPLAYVGGPVAVGGVGFAVSDAATASINPAGDAVYAFLAALWASCVVFAVRWRRNRPHR
ncbi:DUF4870 domain-containing protein [Halorubrum sp. CBA1125]|uniref:DUF4870 domain-containing protein n=1 Tax=Halorubrum sp. CBA1125 TaxID=2668072 RepID=UPI002AA2A43F|nr:DUF4870 domain-containing protein [Halorubrum sp. CBA1125]